MKRSFIYINVFLGLCACGVKSPPPANKQGPGCHAPSQAASATNTCKIRLVSPKGCEEIDLTGGKTFDFVWTTDGTNCQTPYKAYVTGTAGSAVNSFLLNEGGFITPFGGSTPLSANQFSNLTSSDGTFEWYVEDKQQSHPSSLVFKVKK